MGSFKKYLCLTLFLVMGCPKVNNETSAAEKEFDTNDQFLKIVKNITSKGFIRSNYEEKLVDISDVRINLKSKY